VTFTLACGASDTSDGDPRKEPSLELIFLGTGAGAPTLDRNVSSVALRLIERGEIWLFDCGEATQIQLRRAGLPPGQIRRIFISHLHGDHVYGLPGLLASRELAGLTGFLDVYGPPGLAAFLDGWSVPLEQLSGSRLSIHEIEPGVLYLDSNVAVRCTWLLHRIPTLGFRLEENSRPGPFDAERAAALGIPVGPLYGQLKRGASATLPDGRVINGRELVGPPEPGRSLAYCCDTAYCTNAVDLAHRVDLLIHEATFRETERDLAAVSSHATAASAARVAREADVGRLVLTHVSARYGADDAAGLLEEAQAVFPATELAHDFSRVSLLRHREPVSES
jgi:ribonuclease Z